MPDYDKYKLPDGRVVEFEKGTSAEDADAFVWENYPDSMNYIAPTPDAQKPKAKEGQENPAT